MLSRVLTVYRLKLLSVSGLAILLLLSPVSSSIAATQDDLKFAIDQKARELDEITKQLQQTQINLAEQAVRGKSLKTELKRIDDTVSSVALNIQASQVAIQKLSLEQQAIQDTIDQKEKLLSSKRVAIEQLLRDYQQNSTQGLLQMFMQNKTLVESLADAQSISDFNAGLLQDLTQIRQLKADLSTQLDASTHKKKAVLTEQQLLQAKKAIAEDQRVERQQLLAQTQNQQAQYQKMIDELQKKQEAISDEIGDIEDLLRANSGTTGLPLKRPGVLADPIASARMTQGYGKTPYACKLYKKTCFHNGIDFGVPVGTPVLAAADGIIFAAGNNGKLQYGKHIVIKHDNGLVTLYAHLSRQQVKTGDTVKRGDIIGYSGNTGYSKGAHLHFGVYLASSMKLQTIGAAGLVPVGVTLSPLDYM